MAGPGKEASVIIRKVKKVGHGGHHGGAWKVAYADFVTAMMAFFLLLWLLQATAQSQKEGIAEYFTPTIGIRDAAGIGFKGGKTSYDEGRKVAEKSPPGILVGRMPQGPTAQKQERQAPVESTVDAYLFEKAEHSIKQAMEEDPNFRDFKDNVIVEQSPEGLKIEIIDDNKLPLFEPKSAQLTQAGEALLRKMADVIKVMPNRISITGHTEATNYAEGAQYSNWELSTDRANATRRFLATLNMEPTRVAKIVGRADQDLLNEKDPTSPRNRRVTIILLRAAYLKTLDESAPAPRSMLTVPKPTDNLVNGGIIKPQSTQDISAKEKQPITVPEPTAVPAPKSQNTDKSNQDYSPEVQHKNVDTEFKIPDTLKRSLDNGDKLPSGPDNGALPNAIIPTGEGNQ